MNRAILSLSLAVVAAGCNYRSREQSISAADLQKPGRTRISNYMSAPVRPGSPSEEAPGAISRATLLDEARIVRATNDEICFDLVIRTASSIDTAISEMRILLNDAPARMADEEVITIRDYPFTGESNVLVAEHVSRSAYGSLKLTAPVEKVFRVMERRGQVCGTTSGPPRGELALEVTIVEDDKRGNWGEKFVWYVE